MASEVDERLDTEVALLEAMYPEQIFWDANARDLRYQSAGRSLQLRLDGYLNDALPQILSATIDRRDVREEMKARLLTFSLGEEILDSIISAFNEMQQPENGTVVEYGADDEQTPATQPEFHIAKKATVVVWLHHLLNTNKRKQALSPPSSSASGVTKPGYPGVLVYSGPAGAVHEHVNELKQLNWQAFQVRLESDDEWAFMHGSGVKEVESMKDVVAEVGSDMKQLFLEAMRMK